MLQRGIEMFFVTLLCQREISIPCELFYKIILVLFLLAVGVLKRDSPLVQQGGALVPQTVGSTGYIIGIDSLQLNSPFLCNTIQRAHPGAESTTCTLLLYPVKQTGDDEATQGPQTAAREKRVPVMEEDNFQAVHHSFHPLPPMLSLCILPRDPLSRCPGQLSWGERQKQ